MRPIQHHQPTQSQAIVEALGNDLNTPEALRIIDEAFTSISSARLTRVNRDALVQLLETIDTVLGIGLLSSTPDISDESKKIIMERQQARNQKDWDKSDELRIKLENDSIVLQDTTHGTIWEYKD
jgi:cysteinyl-tRNA synthetase